MKMWSTRADARREKYADELEIRRSTVRSATDRKALDGADRALERAARLLRPQVSWWPWWRSGDRKDVWEAIHDAELWVQMLRILPSQVSEAAEHAHRDLPARVAAAKVRELEGESDPVTQAALAFDLVKASHEAADRRIAALHGRTRLIWTLTFAASIAAVGAIWAQAYVADPFLPAPRLANGRQVDASPAVLLALVAGSGAIGGLLRATTDVVGRRALRDVRWFDPRPAQTALKVVTGAWFGVIGVLAVATGFVIAEYTSIGAVLLLGIAFGYGQKVLTGPLDRDVGRILDVEADAATFVAGRNR
jgi:hypothetical protein